MDALIVPVRGPRVGGDAAPPELMSRAKATLFSSTTSSDASTQSRESTMRLILDARRIPYRVANVDIDDSEKAQLAEVRALGSAARPDGSPKPLPLLVVGQEVWVRGRVRLPNQGDRQRWAARRTRTRSKS